MKKLFLIVTAFLSTFFLSAQEKKNTDSKKKDWSKVKLTGRAKDHIMLQYGVAGWAQKPDSFHTVGFSRSFNFYVMIDMPFKTDPRLSVAFGPGIGTDHIFFDKTNISISNHLTPLRFQNLSDTNHFKRYKIVTAFLELPIELRYSSNPENSNKSFKVALGVKVGTLADVHTKGKNWVNKTESTVPGFSNKFTQKQKDKYFFNTNRLAGTFRVGYGNISLFGTYQLGSLTKEGLAAPVKPYNIGLCISGL